VSAPSIVAIPEVIRLQEAVVGRHQALADDGVALSYLYASPAQPRAVVLYLHGIASHAAWFAETAADLHRRGFAVYAPDRRGSGRSAGTRGHLRSHEQASEDIAIFERLIGARHPDTPAVLAASSWAAKLAIPHVARRSHPYDGLMLLGPGLFPRMGLRPLRTVQVLAGHRLTPRSRIPIPLAPSDYTSNADYVELISSDPCRLLTATASFFWQTHRLDRALGAASRRLRLPVLILQGDRDVMMHIDKTRDWASQLRTETTYRSYLSAGHTLDFEPDRSEYVADMTHWLACIARRAPIGV
jgi:alpha-beta hydrolase superfamily lysophospholipase